MSDDRWRLHDGPLLKRLMHHPLPGGTRYTVRSLARETGLSYSKIQKLITEERPFVDGSAAERIAQAVQSRRKALFSPTRSPYEDGDLKGDPRGAR